MHRQGAGRTADKETFVLVSCLVFLFACSRRGKPSSLFGQQSPRNLQFFELSYLVILNFQCHMYCKAFRFLF